MNPQLALAVTASNQTKAGFDQVVADANKVGTALQVSGARATVALGGAGGATANLAAQLNDIGVMLASGQSPLLLALQQGTQINQVFSGLSGAQALGALKNAFLSLISPLSLITIGTIAAGAALFQYVTSLNTDGKQATEVINEQNDLIRRVAENWGDAVPALKAYVDELDRAANISDLNAATDVAIGRAYEDAAAKIGEMRVELGAARTDLVALGASAEEIDALQAVFDTLYTKLGDNTATTEDLQNAMAMLANTTGADTAPTMAGFSGVLQSLIPILAAAAQQASQLRAERDALLMQGPSAAPFYSQQDFIAEQERLNGLTAEQLKLEQAMERVRNEAKSDDVVLSEKQVLDLAEQRLSAEQRRADIASNSKAGAKAVSDVEREREAVTALIEQLEYEYDLIGMSNVEKDVANALRRAGAEATDEERARIEDLIIATNEAEQAQKSLTQQIDGYGKVGQTALRGVWDAMRDGKVEANELADILDRVGDMFWDIAGNMIGNFFGGFGGGGGNWLGSLFGFSEGGSGVVGGVGSSLGGADDTIFMAKARKGEPFAFGDDAVDGIGGSARGGQSVVVVSLDDGLRASVVSEAVGQTVRITRGMVEPVSRAVDQIVTQQRFG